MSETVQEQRTNLLAMAQSAEAAGDRIFDKLGAAEARPLWQIASGIREFVESWRVQAPEAEQPRYGRANSTIHADGWTYYRQVSGQLHFWDGGWVPHPVFRSFDEREHADGWSTLEPISAVDLPEHIRPASPAPSEPNDEWCNCQAIEGQAVYPGPWHPKGDDTCRYAVPSGWEPTVGERVTGWCRLVEAAMEVIGELMSHVGGHSLALYGRSATVAVLRELADTMPNKIPSQVWGPLELRALADEIEHNVMERECDDSEIRRFKEGHKA